MIGLKTTGLFMLGPHGESAAITGAPKLNREATACLAAVTKHRENGAYKWPKGRPKSGPLAAYRQQRNENLRSFIPQLG